jgi:hypothetical protein
MVVIKSDGEYQTSTINLRGRAVAAWFNYVKGKDVYEKAFTIKGVSRTEGNDTDSYVPEFDQVSVSPEATAAAVKADQVLQEWFESSFKNGIVVEEKPQAEETLLVADMPPDIVREQSPHSFPNTDDIPF